VSVWIAALVLLALGVLVAELGARSWMRHRTRHHVWPPGLRVELRQDPGVFPQVESCVRLDVNADGERGGDVPEDRAGCFRVLVAGGSAAECLALDQPTSWPGALERLLRSPDNRRTLPARRVHVGNIARSGIASSELDLIFERVLPQYRSPLAVIVIMVGASDVLKWLEEGAPESRPAHAAGVADTFACHPEQRFGWRPWQWAVVEVARRVGRAWLRPTTVREGAGAWVPAARKMRAQATDLRTQVPDPTVMLDNFDEHFRRLVARAAAQAERVLIARQPWFDTDASPEEAAFFWHGGVGKAWKETISTFYASEVLRDLMGRLDARAASIAEEAGVEQLDLRPVVTPSLEHYYDFFHFTPKGAAIVARAVADVILRRSSAARPARSSRAPVASTTGRHW
jgi:lysophospholipase L1-like esterase